MSQEIRGYRIATCFGARGCPNRAGPDDNLAERLETLLAGRQLLDFLTATVTGRLKRHHEFSVCLADCPNACSRPQIKDIGIIGAAVADITAEPCTLCGACTEACREKALTLDENIPGPVFNRVKCLDCGQCAAVCPTRTIRIKKKAYKVLLGGKLGRHPRLAEPLPGLYNAGQVLDIVGRCVDFYQQHSTDGKRFAQLYAESGRAVAAVLAGLISSTHC